MVDPSGEDEVSEREIARRRDAAIRRALNTPPQPMKSLVGKTERAQNQRATKVAKAARSKTKYGAPS